MLKIKTTQNNICLSAAAILAFSSCNSKQADNSDVAKPNIIFIMADDLGHYDLGSYGQKEIQTPNLDSMAIEGMKFSQVYAGSTVCAPSRSVLMTGQHAGNTTVRGNFSKVKGLFPQDRVPLHGEDTTLAEVLKKAGYVTGITGKWGLGEPETSGVPNNQGFDEWFGYLNQRNAHTYYPEYLWDNGTKVTLEGNLEGKRQTYTHDLFTTFALNFIEDYKDTSFFLYIPYTIPHSDYEIPSLGIYEDKDWKENEKIHAAMVTLMDRDVGMIFEKLKDVAIDSNTIVFFCSDNGAADMYDSRFNSNGDLRGHKRDMYEGGIRVPMIVRWPGNVPANTQSDLVWYFPDVMPTLAAIAGTNGPDSIDGVNVLPGLTDPDFQIKDRWMYWEFHERGFQQAARYNQWKAVRLDPNQKVELYDLSKDPDESDNVANQYPEMVKEFTNYLDTARSASRYWPADL